MLSTGSERLARVGVLNIKIGPIDQLVRLVDLENAYKE